MARKPTQFNWRRQWKKKVEPHLDSPTVQWALDLGMKLLHPGWKSGDPPHALGGWVPFKRIMKGKLLWYQPVGRCHWIVFFSYMIGLLNYPTLRWDIATGDRHTLYGRLRCKRRARDGDGHSPVRQHYGGRVTTAHHAHD